MKVTYISHSGFLIEWKDCYWLFDYFRGNIPELDKNKKLFIFSSHSHSDHFDSVIFDLLKEHPHKEYIFSSDIKYKVDDLIQINRSINYEFIRYMDADEDLIVNDRNHNNIKIHTLKSTDLGVAFLIEYQDKVIYHAGDLHWWVWPGEPDNENDEMTLFYKKIMEYLRDKKIDVAFTPLDPRQEEWYHMGCDYLLDMAHVKHLFPMHFDKDFSVIQKYLSYRESLSKYTNLVKIELEGQSWEVE